MPQGIYKSERHSIVGKRCINGLHVAISFRTDQKKKKERNKRRAWLERGLTDTRFDNSW